VKRKGSQKRQLANNVRASRGQGNMKRMKGGKEIAGRGWGVMQTT